MLYKIAIGENKYEVEIGDVGEDGICQVSVNGENYAVAVENYADVSSGSQAGMQPAMAPAATAAVRAPRTAPRAAAPAGAAGTTSTPKTAAPAVAGAITAPIPGKILSIRVGVGDKVSSGQTVATMEAMKMENNIVANADGVVKEILVQKGSDLALGDAIMIIG